MFKEKIILLDSSKPREYFPERFSNEIYHSKLDYFDGISYESNFSIKYCISGIEGYEINGAEYLIKKGQYIIANEGATVNSFNEHKAEGLSIFIDIDIINDVFRTFELTENKLLDNPEEVNVTPPFFECIYSEKDSLGKFLNNLAKEILLFKDEDQINITPDLYYKIAEQLFIQQQNTFKKINSLNRIKKHTREEVFRRVNQAINYINQNLSRKFDLDELSKASYLSKYYLIRSFKEVTNKTPFEYYHQQRMEFARKLILKKSRSLNEIASTTNFNDLSAFSNAFKAYFGVAPSLYSK